MLLLYAFILVAQDLYHTIFFSDKEHQIVSPEGESTAPASQASDHSDLPPKGVIGVPPNAPPQGPQEQRKTSAALNAQVPLHSAGQSLKEPRGRGGGTGVIIGDQPPLDVDALLKKRG